MGKLRNNERTTGPRKGRTLLLMLVFTVTVALFVTNLVFVNIYSAQDQVFVQRASDLRVLSQQIAKNASEAITGSDQAFSGLAQTRAQFEDTWSLITQGKESHVDSGIGFLTALPGRGAEISAQQPALESLWVRVRTSADLVLANRERIQSLNAIAASVSANIPQLQRNYDEVVNMLLDNNESLSTIAAAQRQAWLSERIALNLNRITSGDSQAQAGVEQFQRDISLFLSNHEALLEGDRAIGVTRVEAPRARTELEAISELFSIVEQRGGEIIAAAPDIIGASQAVDSIVDDSLLLLEEVTALTQYFTDFSGQHLASPLLGYVLLSVILLLISIYGLMMIQQSRTAEKVTAELNARNNSAVLNLLEEISDLANGNLTVTATVSEDFTGAIADAINYAIGQLRGLVSAITEVTLQVSRSTSESKNTVQYLSSASERQSSSIASVSNAIRDMERSINRVSENARKSLGVAKDSVKIASGGAEVVKSTIRGMDTIREQIQETSKRIKRLGESSQEIGGFVSLINDIADHTNTLSLNAAIQAAMAGDAGKGFGVVADEVHALAERSSSATRQIESLVRVIQRDINEAVYSMEQTTAEVVHGTQLAEGAGEALDDIETVSKELEALVEEITAAASRQASTASEITGSMEIIQQITTETSSGTRATSEFMGTLGSLTQRLQSAVAGFSLEQQKRGKRAVAEEPVPIRREADERSPAAQEPHVPGLPGNYKIARVATA